MTQVSSRKAEESRCKWKSSSVTPNRMAISSSARRVREREGGNWEGLTPEIGRSNDGALLVPVLGNGEWQNEEWECDRVYTNTGESTILDQVFNWN